jgi:LPXTG-site transpeptidase (sortase) family protein
MTDSDTTATDRRFRIGLAISVVSLLIMGIGLFAVVSALSSNDANLPHQGNLSDIVGADSIPTPGSGGVAVPDSWPAGAKPVSIEVPRIDVDAPIIELGFEAGSNIPAVPTTGYQAAWYDFGPTPGVGYNALFAGHVDWQTAEHSPIPGVFYRLRELQIGDDVMVTLEDGTVVHYKVTGNVAAQFDDPNIVKAMQPTKKDVITILTCGGTWEPNPYEENGGNYTHRIIVRAERVTDAAVGAAAGAG